MKKILFILFMIFYNCACAQDTLTIIHLNDTHSCLSPRNADPNGTIGGIARAATIIGQIRMTNKNVLTLHAGDSFVGDMFFNYYYGAAEFKLLQMLGLDAMTIGNHEFDLTPHILDTACTYGLAENGFPLLSANLLIPDTELQDLKKYVKPYIIKQFGNIKAGIFGLTTPAANSISQPSPAFIDTNLGITAGAMVQELTQQGCSVIILLSHLGITYDKMIAAAVPGINIIIGGHDHYLLESVPVITTSGQTTWIVQAGANYSHIGQTMVFVNNGRVTGISSANIPLDNSIPEEESVKSAVDNMINEIETAYGIPFYAGQVGIATGNFTQSTDIYSSGPYDTPLGNLVTDAYRDTTKTDIAIIAGGSLALDLNQGAITPSDLFRAIGYGFNEVNGLDFRLVTFKITGAELWKAFESVLSMVEENDEFLPQVSGMKYFAVLPDPPGERLKSIEVAEIPLDPSRTYSVTVNEFLMVPLREWFNIEVSEIHLYTDYTEFQALLDYVIKKQVISPYSEGRVVLPVEQTEMTVDKFELLQNYPNPFNPSTTISYSLSERQNVTLKIYNSLAQEVATLSEGEMDAGKHRVEWNGDRFSSGIYFCRIMTEKYSRTIKLTLVK